MIQIWNSLSSTLWTKKIPLIEDEEAKESFLSYTASSSTESIAPTGKENSDRLVIRCLIASNIVFIGIIAWLVIPRTWLQGREMNFFLKQTSAFSPVLEELEIPTQLTRMNGSLLTPTENVPWTRQLFSNDTEIRWHTFDLPWTIPISANDVRKLGKDPDTVAKFTEDWGFGEDSYMAQIDVFHQLHCLNQLRSVAFRTHPHSPWGPQKSHGKYWWMHMEHCVDMLMQNLMCNANVDLITLQWVEAQPHPFPDFSIDHQCRDLETISRWQEKVGVDFVGLMTVKMPEDVNMVPAEDGYWDLAGPNGSDEFEDR